MVRQARDTLHHCIFALDYGLVLSTRERRRVLTTQMLDRFEMLARERVEAWAGRLIKVSGEPDHVRVLFAMPPMPICRGSSTR